MRNPAAFSVQQPRLVLLATLLCVAFGALSYAGLPRQENPRLPDRFLTVTTYLPGAEPEKVELLVSKVLEERIAQVDDLDEIFSNSSDGRSYMIVQVERGAPYADRLEQVQRKVEEARSALPPEASEPEVDAETLATYTMILVLTGREAPPLLLREEARELERALERLPGVRKVDAVGLPEEEIEVAVDLRAIAARGTSLASVVASLAERNAVVPGGDLDLGAIRSNLQADGSYASTEELAATWLAGPPQGLPVRLADVARVERRLADPELNVRSSGLPGVALALEMQPGRNAVAFGQQVRAFVAGWSEQLPQGLGIEIAADEPTYVGERLALLMGSLLQGLLIVVVLTLLGLGWRSGLVVSASIPLSLVTSMGLLSLAGLELHQMSIAALVIAVGLVVDEAIVVTDNVQRHIDAGAAPREAAVRGLGEIHLAVLSGSATTIAAFIPLMLMEGDIGDFLSSIPIAVSCMLLASVSVAHFVTPLLAAFAHGWSRGAGRARPARSRRVEAAYRQFLGRLLLRRRWVIGGFAAAFAASLVLLEVRLLPPAFFPTADRHQFLVDVRLPDGARFEETDALMRRVEERIAADADVRDWHAFIGADAPKFFYNEFPAGRGENLGMLIVNTNADVPFRRTGEVVTRLDAAFKAEIPGALVRARELKQGYGATADIRIYLQGDELERLRAISRRVGEILKGVPGIAQVRESFGYDPLTLRAEVDAERAGVLGVTHRDVASALRTALDGALATRFRERDEEIDVVVRAQRAQRESVQALRTLPIASASGEAVPLEQVASLTPGWTTRRVLRWQRKREASLDADVAPGASVGEVAARVEREVGARLRLPRGYEIHFEGERAEVRESFLTMARAAVVAVLLIYIILVVQFGSLVQPLLILLAIPMGLMGAVLGLVASGSPLGLNAFLGMIALTGIVVNDSIVLMDTMNRLRADGEELEDAVMNGAERRLRAVLLTSVTTIGGLLPLGLAGGAFWAPFAWAMIFGLAASTLLTLAVQPAAYLMLERRRRARAERDSLALAA